MAGAGQQGRGEDQVGRRRRGQPDEPGQRLDRERDRPHREDVERAQPDDGEVVAGQPRPRDQLEQDGAGDRDHPQAEDPQQAEPARPATGPRAREIPSTKPNPSRALSTTNHRTRPAAPAAPARATSFTRDGPVLRCGDRPRSGRRQRR